MSTLDHKRIVIKIPRFDLRTFLTLRVAVVLALLLFTSAFAYWYHAIRPWLWIASAHLESPSTILCSDTAGRIVEMHTQEGDLVKKGQVLFVLDRDLILAKHAQAKQLVESLNDQIEVEKVRMGKAMEEYLIASAEEEPDLVKKQLVLMEEAQAKTEAAHSQLAAAQSELNLLDLQVKKMTLTAPFDGVILKKSKNLGAVVSFGDPIYTLLDPNTIWVEAEVPEQEIRRIALGTPARIQLPAYPQKEFSGKVAWIGPATVAKSSQLPFSGKMETIPIKISFESFDAVLKPGLSARVGINI